MEDDLKKKIEDDFNFKAVLLRLFNNKNHQLIDIVNIVFKFHQI